MDPSSDAPSASTSASGPRVILVGTKMAENVGAAARAMANFGLSDLWLVAPRCRLDRRAYALATHAAPVLDAATIVDTSADAVVGLTRVIGTTARSRRDDATPELLPEPGLADLPEAGGGLMFGPEDFGLANEDLDYCQAYVRIPTAEFSSLNLAQAVNVLAYVWFRQRHDPEAEAAPAPHRAAPPPPPHARELAPRDAMERMYDQLATTLLRIGYTDEPRVASIMRMMRGVFDKAALEPRELSALRGLWSQTLWAAERDPDELPVISGESADGGADG